jgi:hypothetical protein
LKTLNRIRRGTTMIKSKTSSIQRALLGTLLAASAAITTPTAAYSDMITDWNEIAIQTFPSTVLGPTQARFLGIVHAAIYDAVNAIDSKHQVYAIDIKAPPGASMEAAAATAAHDTLIKLFPVQQSALDAALAESLSKIPDGPAKRDGITVGKESAEKTVAAHANDGATAKVPYTPGTSPDSWQSTPPTMAPAALTQWGTVIPFMLKSGDQITVPGPFPVTSSAYAKDVNEVKSVGAADSKTRTSEQTAVAIFWTTTTSTPWNAVARAAAKAHNNSLAENARLFALLNMITSDSQVACWCCKYKYNFLRPITAIHNADRLGNSAIKSDSNWESLLCTPAHPDYPAGHCAFSASAAKVLQDFFGSDEVTADVMYPPIFGMTRHWHSFSEISNETNNARVWGGIHTRHACTDAAELGRQVAEYCLANYMKPVK